MDPAYAVALVVHVLAASVWFGGSVRETLRRPLGGLPDARALPPPPLAFYNSAGLITIAAGGLAYALYPGGAPALRGTPWGKAVSVAILCALFSLYLVNFALRPSSRAIERIRKELPADAAPPVQLLFLAARLRFTTVLNVMLLTAAMAAMVVADLIA